MALYNLIIKDNSTKECEVLFYLNSDRERLVTKNIVAIINGGKPHIQIQDSPGITIPESFLSSGWKGKPGLYDSLVLLYNWDNPKYQLTAWCI